MARWVESVVSARMLVGSLGESASPPWWRSQATTAAGGRMFELLFPRTALTASLETASRAACLEHDRRIARSGQFHLFRLPVGDEDTMRDWLQQPASLEALRSVAGMSSEDRLAAIEALAGKGAVVDAEGPTYCGPIDALHRTATIQKICAAYLAGFRAGRPTYPYLEEVRT